MLVHISAVVYWRNGTKFDKEDGSRRLNSAKCVYLLELYRVRGVTIHGKTIQVVQD